MMADGSRAGCDGMVVRMDASERFAFELLRRVTGHEVLPTDDGSAPRQVDGVFHDGDGMVHAVEVTRLLDPDAGQLMGELDRRGMRLSTDTLEWVWDVRVEPSVSLDALETQLEPMLRECEEMGLVRLDETGWRFLRGWPLGRAVIDGELDAFGMPNVENEGYVWLLPHGSGGASPGMRVVPGWLSDALAGPLVRKVSKLADWDADFRHLVVGLHSSAVPFGVICAFVEDDAVPEDAPAVPDVLDAVWLVSEWSTPPLSWTREHGWRRHDVHES